MVYLAVCITAFSLFLDFNPLRILILSGLFGISFALSSPQIYLIFSQWDIAFGFLLARHIALQLFPTFRYFGMFGSSLVIPLTSPGDPMVTNSLPLYDFSVGTTLTLNAFKKRPAWSLYQLFPLRNIISSYAMGVFNAIEWNNDRRLNQPNKIDHYFAQAVAFHSADISKWITSFWTDDNLPICNTMLSWLKSNQASFLSTRCSPAFLPSASSPKLPPPVPTSISTSAPRQSFAAIAASPAVKAPVIQSSDKHRLKATIKGT